MNAAIEPTRHDRFADLESGTGGGDGCTPRIPYVNLCSENGVARNAIDGQPGTARVTEWSRRAPKHPHWLSIDLQSPQVFNGFAYQPRATSVNGRIANFELQVSTNAQTWTTISSGTFANTGNLQTVACKLPRGL